MAFDLIVIGASLGGLRALSAILATLPDDFPIPIVIVQHRHKDSDGELRSVLQQRSALPVREAEDKQPIEAGTVYLAPPDYHLLVERGTLALSTEGPVQYARPAIDVLFESAADSYATRVVGVVLTGASRDGADGLALIKARGGCTIVQDPATAECRVMPEATLATGPADYVLALSDIGQHLIRLANVVSKAGT